MGVHDSSDDTVLIIVSIKDIKPLIESILLELNIIQRSSIAFELTEKKKELIKHKLPLGDSSQLFEDKILQMVALMALEGK